MTACKSKTITQCTTCPWKVGCVPERDIPNYQLDLAKKLDRTIAASPEDSLRAALSGDGLQSMACHYSKSGEEIPCAGWIHNQLGPGNNIAVRLRVMGGHLPIPKVDGDQHERYEDTLPCEPVATRKPRARRKART